MKSSAAALESTSGTAADQLVALSQGADLLSYDPKAVAHLQMQAIRERFDLRRQQIRVLDQRAGDLGISEIKALEDLVPLLFSHQTYKSYPESFVRDNKWGLMNRWLDTLSAVRVGNIDVSDISNTDAWVARLSEHGHHVLLSSGTSGKASFLNRTEQDRDFSPGTTVQYMRSMLGIPKGQLQPVFLLGPHIGTHIFVKQLKDFATEFGRPDAIYWLSDLPVTEADIKRQAELRGKVAGGTASPGEIQELENHARERQEHMREHMGQIAAALDKHRSERVFIAGLWLPHFMLMEAAHKLGMGDGVLHPDSFVFFGGGIKGAKLPVDYREQVARFHGLDKSCYFNIYGMTELSSGFPGCKAGRYHITPWVIPLILDKEGEKLINKPQGIVEGRMAFFDVVTQARWGGVISGDKVEVDFSPCPCGLHSPSIISVTRYSDLPGGDDKLSCAGTMSSYVRGAIED